MLCHNIHRFIDPVSERTHRRLPGNALNDFLHVLDTNNHAIKLRSSFISTACYSLDVEHPAKVRVLKGGLWVVGMYRTLKVLLPVSYLC